MFYQRCAVSCVNFRHRNVTRSASVISEVSVVVRTVKLSAAQRALLHYQPHVSTYLFFYFHEPTVKRARAHTDALQSVSRVFKLLSYFLLSLSYAVTVVGLFITRISL